MDQMWVRVSVLSPSHFCLCYEAITSEALLTSSFTCACFSLRAVSLRHSQQPNFSPRLRTKPSATLRWPPDKSISGVYWGCVWSLRCFDPNRTRGCYTRVRKRVASHYLCSLDGTSLPVWTGWLKRGDWWQTHILLQFHVMFSHITRVCYSMKGFDWPTYHNILFFKPHYVSFIASEVSCAVIQTCSISLSFTRRLLTLVSCNAVSIKGKAPINKMKTWPGETDEM